MKLYIPHCHVCSNKISLGITALTRNDLRARFGGSDFYCTCGTCHTRSIYDVHNVLAESDSSGTPSGAIIGGLIGLLGGPIGAIIGATLGGAAGSVNDTEDIRKKSTFNNSF